VKSSTRSHSGGAGESPNDDLWEGMRYASIKSIRQVQAKKTVSNPWNDRFRDLIERHASTKLITLDLLTLEEIDAMFSAALKVRSMPQDVSILVHDLSGGSLFWVREILDFLREHGSDELMSIVGDGRLDNDVLNSSPHRSDTGTATGQGKLKTQQSLHRIQSGSLRSGGFDSTRINNDNDSFRKGGGGAGDDDSLKMGAQSSRRSFGFGLADMSFSQRSNASYDDHATTSRQGSIPQLLEDVGKSMSTLSYDVFVNPSRRHASSRKVQSSLQTIRDVDENVLNVTSGKWGKSSKSTKRAFQDSASAKGSFIAAGSVLSMKMQSFTRTFKSSKASFADDSDFNNIQKQEKEEEEEEEEEEDGENPSSEPFATSNGAGTVPMKLNVLKAERQSEKKKRNEQLQKLEQQRMEKLSKRFKLDLLVVSRFEKLLLESQRILRTASIIGYSFSRHLLFGMLPSHLREEMSASLQHLILRNWLYQDAEDEALYLFTHPYIHRIIYELTPSSDRRDMHFKIGTYIETTSGTDDPTQFTLMGQHFSHCDDGKALYYISQAVVHALQEKHSQHLLGQCLPLLSMATAVADAHLGNLRYVRQLADRCMKKFQIYHGRQVKLHHAAPDTKSKKKPSYSSSSSAGGMFSCCGAGSSIGAVVVPTNDDDKKDEQMDADDNSRNSGSQRSSGFFSSHRHPYDPELHFNWIAEEIKNQLLVVDQRIAVAKQHEVQRRRIEEAAGEKALDPLAAAVVSADSSTSYRFSDGSASSRKNNAAGSYRPLRPQQVIAAERSTAAAMTTANAAAAAAASTSGGGGVGASEGWVAWQWEAHHQLDQALHDSMLD